MTTGQGRWTIGRISALAGAALFCLVGSAATTNLHADERTDERWEMLRDMYFQGRTVEEADSLLGLEAPTRAHDAALVPIRITMSPTPGLRIDAVHLIVDENPVPLAATFRFAEGDKPQAVETRIRVNAYTNVTAIAETSDGRLLKTARYVKAAGGCSAPALKNLQTIVARMGKMKLNLPDTIAADTPMTAQLLISHPNYTGMQYDQVNHYYIPAHHVTSVKIRYNDEPVLDVTADISLSEDPSIHFTMMPEKSGTLEVVTEDSKGRIHKDAWPIRTTPGS